MEPHVIKCLLTQMCEFLKQTNQEEDFIKMLKKNLENEEPTEEEICLVKKLTYKNPYTAMNPRNIQFNSVTNILDLSNNDFTSKFVFLS